MIRSAMDNCYRAYKWLPSDDRKAIICKCRNSFPHACAGTMREAETYLKNCRNLAENRNKSGFLRVIFGENFLPDCETIIAFDLIFVKLFSIITL